MGQGGQADVDRLARGPEAVGEPAVLRGSLLSDIHSAQDFEPADHAGQRGGGERAIFLQHPVDPQSDLDVFLARVDVDVGGLTHQGGVEEFVAERDGSFAVGIGVGAAVGPHSRWACGLHGRGTAAEHPLQRPAERVGISFLRADGKSHRSLHRFENRAIPRIGARHVHLPIEAGEGKHLTPQGQRGGDLQSPRRIDAHLVHVEQDGRCVVRDFAAHDRPPGVWPAAAGRIRIRTIRSRSTDGLRAMAMAVVSEIHPPVHSRARSCSRVCIPAAPPDSMAE